MSQIIIDPNSAKAQYLMQQLQASQAFHQCAKCNERLPVQSFSKKKDQSLYKWCKSCMDQLNERKREQGKLCMGCKQMKFISEFCDPRSVHLIHPFCNFCMIKLHEAKEVQIEPQPSETPQDVLYQYLSQK